jgi:hypothetical protein
MGGCWAEKGRDLSHLLLRGLSDFPERKEKPGTVVHICNASTQEAKALGLSLRPAWAT